MTNPILSSSRYFFLFFLLGIAYVLGLFVPLMDNDAGHHANIALHIYQNSDFVNLIDRGGKDYLDKPHLLFWLSAISYYIFGVTAWAYKLPSVLFSIAAIWATYKLGKRLYDNETGKLAALILGSAQAFILACMDVRMDALLSSCIILATWQLVESVTEKKWFNIILSALFMALGFSTKGLVGIIMPGIAIFFYLLYKRDFKQLFHWKWILTGLLTALFMLPVVYC
jgi:4-amino-4-deoxy-L-arabinose transferase-like glycosyltransferase